MILLRQNNVGVELSNDNPYDRHVAKQFRERSNSTNKLQIFFRTEAPCFCEKTYFFCQLFVLGTGLTHLQSHIHCFSLNSTLALKPSK